MEYWVYITEFEKATLNVAFSLAVDKVVLTLQPNSRVVYLCPFKDPFDALAHKHLLDHLSKESVLNWVNNHRQETKVWLEVVSKINKKE